MRSLHLFLSPFAALLLVGPASAQQWNGASVLDLVQRGIERRAAEQAGDLADFQARAQGFVFFLAQFGEEGLAEPPQLIKADQLVLEVYWKAPGASKQRIIGWRDRVDLPTDIRYHRDHLGIIQGGFGDMIRLGDGDEVSDVPHPLSPAGPALYDFALRDSLAIRLPDRLVRVHEIAFRPRDFNAPRIVGSMYLDADAGDLVRLRFSFTRRAYIDRSLEDITIVLDNGLWDQRFWLPSRQEIEIRRRTSWLDLPARGIIRGQWEISGYEFNVGLDDRWFLGPEIIEAHPAVRDTFPWASSLDEDIARAAGTVVVTEMEAVRDRARGIAAGRALDALPTVGPAAQGLSDIVRVNRVEGLALGLGYVVRPGAGPLTLRGRTSFGLTDEQVKGRLDAVYRRGGLEVALLAGREVRDLGDEPVISGVLNSLLAQERGLDHGDYYRWEGVHLEIRSGLGRHWRVSVGTAMEWTHSLDAIAGPASGTLRPNPALGGGRAAVGTARFAWQRRSVSGRGQEFMVRIEGGLREADEYVRVNAAARIGFGAGPGLMVISASGGAGTEALPSHRQFVLGGRGTLVGEPFRAWGGRRAVLARAEWLVPIPFVAVPLGPFASTGSQLHAGPFVALGATAAPLDGAPWSGSEGLRPVFGVAAEWFHRLLRVEAGMSPDRKQLRLVVDVRRDLWGIL